LTRTATQNACGPDGVNSICFDQADMAFTPGVLAFTQVISTDRLGVQVGSSAVSTQLGQILDADSYFNPSDSRTAFATPQALAAAPTAYDFESVLTYELGHFLGFSHSAVWGAIMFPFAPAPGTFSGCGRQCSSPTRRWATMTRPDCAFSMPTRRTRCTEDRSAGGVARLLAPYNLTARMKSMVWR